MGRIVLVLLAAAGVVVGCDALEPAWGDEVHLNWDGSPPAMDCADVCAMQGALCLANSCEGATIEVDGDAVTAECGEPIWSVVGEAASWSGTVACCCGS